MRTVLQWLSAVVVAAMMAGCATAPDPVKVAAIKRMKQLGVVSAAADVFARQYTGLTVFNNEYEEVAIGDWGVDRAYEAQLSAAVARMPSGRAAVVLADQAPAYSPANRKGGVPDATQMSVAVKASCKAKSLDGVLLVSKAETADFIANTNQRLSGVGVYSRGPGTGVTAIHVLARLSLFDCATGEVVAGDLLGTTAIISDGSARARLLYKSESSVVARRPAAGWTAETRNGLRQTVVDLPGNAWDDTLQRLFADPAR